MNAFFGQCLWADYPFDEGIATKRRLVFVLADLGESLIVAYVTTNPELKGIRLGQVIDAHSVVLVPNRYAVVSKRNVYWNASTAHGRVVRIDLAAHREAASIVRAIILIARNGGYGSHGVAILANLEAAVRVADQRHQQKEAACTTTCRPNPMISTSSRHSAAASSLH
jgi:hypothetical protein